MMRVVLCDKRLITALMAGTVVNNCLIPYSSMPTKASGGLISEISTQTRHEDARLMRKYKRRLLMILGSIDPDGHLSQVRITNLATSSGGRILTVFWTMAEDFRSDITAWKVDELLRNANKSIRQRLARENAYRKVPILNFIHAPSDLLSDPTEDQVDVNSCHIVKPNNVYGLPWDEYMREVRRNRQDDTVMVDSENMDADCHQERGSCPSQAANWARRWQKQHNAKLVAKRERKRSHQMLGMWQLSKEMEELD
ncbi:Ribosome binding factor A [Echinococcus multilocularis]|uniref:Ribosome binding factor A n=1 Tax=Echinococcus multilocularis TaxID=6211 RepID=A0A068Y9V9_ECHMU|nr:Ribosome binding factor A [Echinococcus multilocularis]